MTQKPAFSFRQNKENHLPHAKSQSVASEAMERGKPGPKVDPKIGQRTKAQVTYLSEAEERAWKDKLDGRPSSVILRKLILEHIENDATKLK